jgi:hypothetical protein
VIGAWTIVVHEAAGVLQHPRGFHDALDGAVQRASFGREVVLVLDQDDGGAGRIDGHGARLLPDLRARSNA